MDKLDAILDRVAAVHGDIRALQTQMVTLIGNGQPGRVQLLEKRLDDLQGQIAEWRGGFKLLCVLCVVLGGADVAAVWHILAR